MYLAAVATRKGFVGLNDEIPRFKLSGSRKTGSSHRSSFHLPSKDEAVLLLRDTCKQDVFRFADSIGGKCVTGQAYANHL
jgi:hypothetical protein